MPLAPTPIAKPIVVEPIEPKPVEPPPPATGTVRGHVVSTEGLPIEDVAIKITHRGAAIELRTDADGAFQATPELGTIEIVAELAEYEPHKVTAVVDAKTQTQITIQLARKIRQGQLRGQVLSFGGKALEATVIVSAAGKEIARTTADQDGHYTVELPAGSFDVTIEAAGHVTQKRTIKVKLDGVTVLNLDMRGVK